MPESDFETLLLNAVDEGLSVLGESSKEAIYFHLDISFNIKKNEIPYKIEAFTNAIEKIFGLGANFLKILIMKRLHEKIGQSFKWPKSKNYFTFTEFMATAELNFRRNKTVKNRRGTSSMQKTTMET